MFYALLIGANSTERNVLSAPLGAQEMALAASERACSVTMTLVATLASGGSARKGTLRSFLG
jgi:hypothetical protein